MFSTKDVDEEWSFSRCTPSETGKWTHSYHRYPAKFIPQIVERLIGEYAGKEDTHINDPFMGCGTTIVTAISMGFKASGTDVNKLAYLITKVKCTPVDPSYLVMKVNRFIEKMTEAVFSNDVIPLIPQRHVDRINYWFLDDTKRDLGKILRVIYSESDVVIRNFLLVAFSHILRSCSLWSQKSIKPIRDMSKIPIKPHEALRRHLMRMCIGNSAFWNVVPLRVKENLSEYLNIKAGDARKQPVPDNSVDLIITSSPYVTSYEYADLHQLSTIWLDLADDLLMYKRSFIGTSCRKKVTGNLRSSIAKDIVNKMFNKDERKAKEIETFFIDMEEVFDENFRALKIGGRCCYVVGNTKLRGIDILNSDVFAESLECSGFKLEKIIKRRIPTRILPKKRNEETGRFASSCEANSEAYPVEYIIVGLKG